MLVNVELPIINVKFTRLDIVIWIFSQSKENRNILLRATPSKLNSRTPSTSSLFYEVDENEAIGVPIKTECFTYKVKRDVKNVKSLKTCISSRVPVFLNDNGFSCPISDYISNLKIICSLRVAVRDPKISVY